MDHRFVPGTDKLAPAPHPKLILEFTFPYADGVTHDDLDEALVEASFVVLAAFEDGKIGKGQVEDALGNPFLSWRLEDPSKIGETPTIEGAHLVLKRDELSLSSGILCIKALRNQWPDLGLRGAKDLYDSLRRENG